MLLELHCYHVLAGADGHNVPDFVCTIYFDRKAPCLGGVIALDGLTGNTVWQHWTSHPIFMVDCSADLTEDKTNDCLISGKGGVSWKYPEKLCYVIFTVYL